MQRKAIVSLGAALALGIAALAPAPSVAAGFGDMMNPSKWFGGKGRDYDYDYYRGPGYGGWGGYPGYGYPAPGWGGYPPYGWGGYPGYGYPGYGVPAQQPQGSAEPKPPPPQ